MWRLIVVLLVAVHAQAARQALLVGINDYRDWPDLSGAVNDVREFQQLLRGFEIVALTDDAATRDAILQSLDRLAMSAKRGDVIFFYYAGHGSRVRNSKTDEPDGFDETLVAVDSQHVRDKELRRRFNAILDRGARLTIVLDNCHSASGARAGYAVRGVEADPRDVADPARGPRPENRGALVISATEDHGEARETRDARGQMHGAFSWALIRALRDAHPGEPAIETFLRARALLQAELPAQVPVIAGNDTMRRAPFLGTTASATRNAVAVQSIRRDGTVVLQGGRAEGLQVGDEVDGLRITRVQGLTRSEAQGEAKPGALVEVRKAASWRDLESPEPSPFRIEIRERGRSVDRLLGGRRYQLHIAGEAARKRYVYLFVIDAHGKSTLLFPRSGSVENGFTRAPENALATLEATPPYGDDLYVLLTSDEPLANPWILESRSPHAEEGWSIARRVIPSAAARR